MSMSDDFCMALVRRGLTEYEHTTFRMGIELGMNYPDWARALLGEQPLTQDDSDVIERAMRTLVSEVPVGGAR